MKAPRADRIACWSMTALAVLVFVLAFHRARYASFTHDESYSYMYYPHLSLSDILTHKEAFTNNHLLNTLGMKYSEILLGTSELTLRLPNLLALVFYLYFGFLLVRPFGPILSVAFFTLLCTNPFLLELFTIARGYGLSCGFLLMAQYFLQRAVHTRGTWPLIAFHFASLLATLANFTLLTAYAASTLVCLIAIGRGVPEQANARPSFRKFALAHALLSLVSASLLAWPLIQMHEQNHLDFGGKSGFYPDTVNTLLHSFSPGTTMPPGWEIASWTLGSILMAIALIRTLRTAKDTTGDRSVQDLSLTVYTFVLVCSFSVLAHAFFSVDYLTDRFAMFLLPLFLLSSLHAIAGSRYSLIRRSVPAIAVVAAVCSWISLESHFGPQESVQWHYDMTTKDAMGTIKADMERHHVADRTLKIGNNWLFEPTINFYRTIWKIDHLARADREGPKSDDDYRIVFAGDSAQPGAARFDTLTYFSQTNVLVMRRASLH